ncbi:hypothetical protein L484_012091 [Morus notabilis]|uniref:Legume lectin domain-containing protein n=2 Tax=Morus notabilis TaxID=981085 RepID=W9RQ22_9ROSA|nr:hypothetical protein L484_012091 [Morus notabilis]
MGMSFFIIFLIFPFFFFPLVNSFNNSAADSLDALLEDFAFDTLVEHRRHTGVLYKATSPANLSGIQVSVLKLRSRTMWNKGANFSHFSIPPRTTSSPHVRRLALVYQDLGNWSSEYYIVPGYKLVTSVVGFMAFDASNSSAKSITRLNLTTRGKPISIDFHNLTVGESVRSQVRCVIYAANGTTSLSEMSLPGVCQSREQGHFSVVIPEGELKGKQKLCYWWFIGFVLAFAVLVLGGITVVVLVRLLRTKKIQIMERHADEDLALASRWVGQSKMPSAAVTRTLPVLESGCFT